MMGKKLMIDETLAVAKKKHQALKLGGEESAAGSNKGKKPAESRDDTARKKRAMDSPVPAQAVPASGVRSRGYRAVLTSQTGYGASIDR